MASGRPSTRLIGRPFRDFLDTEISGGVVLLVATAVALIWANSPRATPTNRVELSAVLGSGVTSSPEISSTG